VRVEAETRSFSNGTKTNTNQPDFSGSSFVDGFDASGSPSGTLQVEVPKAGRYPQLREPSHGRPMLLPRRREPPAWILLPGSAEPQKNVRKPARKTLLYAFCISR
jgi:hypothetical protein